MWLLDFGPWGYKNSEDETIAPMSIGADQCRLKESILSLNSMVTFFNNALGASLISSDFN